MLRGLSLLEKVVAVGVPLGALLIGAAGGVVLVAWVLRAARRLPAPASRNRRVAERVLVTLLAVELLCAGYAWRVEPYWAETTHHRVELDALAPGAKPIRLVHISDTHCDARVRLEEDLPAHIDALRPDAVVFTGDAINSPDGQDNFRTLIRELTRIAPVYAVAGNWDHYLPFSPRELYRGTDARLLEGQALPLECADGRVWLAGAADGDVAGLVSAVADVPDGAAVIALYHRPDELERVCGAADVYLTGHTHGGQLALPLYGPMVTLSRHGRRFARGRHNVGGTALLVSRGIGMEGGPAPRVRFLSRPEIGLIELTPRR
ncbi:MAG: metallophosphoesterase [Planctomycetota bacterium]